MNCTSSSSIVYLLVFYSSAFRCRDDDDEIDIRRALYARKLAQRMGKRSRSRANNTEGMPSIVVFFWWHRFFGLIQNEFDDNCFVPIFGEHKLSIHSAFVSSHSISKSTITLFLLSNVCGCALRFHFGSKSISTFVKSMSNMDLDVVLVAINGACISSCRTWEPQMKCFGWVDASWPTFAVHGMWCTVSECRSRCKSLSCELNGRQSVRTN